MPAQSQLTPLGKWCLRLAGILAVLLIAVVVNYVAHGGTEGLNPVAEAAQRTAQTPGSQIAIEVKYSSSSSTTELVGIGGGEFDARTGRTEVNLSMPIPGSQALSLEAISTPQKVFMRSSAFEGELPPGKLWLAVEPLLGGSEKTAFASNDSAKGTLEALEAVGGGVDREDQQTVRGHLTTRYKGEIDPARVVDLLRERGDAKLTQAYEILVEKAPQSIGVEVWIDGRGLVRQVSMVQQVPLTSGTELSAETRMQFYDFGSRPTIATPKRRQVFDYTPVLRAELGLEDGSALGPLAPPRGGKPLTAAPFRRRAIVICRRVEGEGVGLLRRSRALVREMKGLGPGQAEEGRQLVRKFARAIGEPLFQLSRRGTHELAGLDPPPSLAAEFHRYLVLDVKQMEWNLAQTRAYELGNVNLPSLAGRKAEEPREKAERTEVATHLGLSRCEKVPRSEGQAKPAESSFE